MFNMTVCYGKEQKQTDQNSTHSQQSNWSTTGTLEHSIPQGNQTEDTGCRWRPLPPSTPSVGDPSHPLHPQVETPPTHYTLRWRTFPPSTPSGGNPSHPQFKRLPSGRLFRMPMAKKNMFKHSFLPCAVGLLNTKLKVSEYVLI